MAQLEVVTRGGESLKAVARDLKKAGDKGKQLRKGLRQALVKGMKPMRSAVQRAALGLPSHGPQHTGLRKALARATRNAINLTARSAKARLEVDPRRMPDGQKSLPAYVDGGKKPWRHPVYGNKNRWVKQDAHPFFWGAARPHIKDVRAAINAAVDKVARDLEH